MGPGEPSGPAPRAGPSLLMLCTGNAARSVMGGVFLEPLRPDVAVVTAGTHVVEGQPPSPRTREALAALGVSMTLHRSRQLDPAAAQSASLIVAMAAEHVHYVRHRHPEAAARTATLRWLAENLPAGPGPLRDRVVSLQLGQLDPESQGDVADPAGRDAEAYLACAREVSELIGALAPRL